MSYTLFIDESGDEAIEIAQIERGASELFFFDAFLVDNNKILEHGIKAVIDFNKFNLHDTDKKFIKNLKSI